MLMCCIYCSTFDVFQMDLLEITILHNNLKADDYIAWVDLGEKKF